MAKKQDSEVEELQGIIRRAGLRSTTSRIAVLQRLRNATSPLSHAELADVLKPLGFDKATVFRNLADLTDVGLILRAELGDHVWRFEMSNPEKHEDGHHPHFVCVDCGNVTCLEQKSLEKSLKSVALRIGKVTEVLLRGHCNNCQ